MKVYIIEPNASGHRLYYVRVLAEELPAGAAVWLTTRESADSHEARLHLEPLIASGALKCHVVEPWPGRRSALRAASRDADCSTIVVPDGDRWLPSLLGMMLLGPISARRAKYRVLLMRPPTSQLRSNAVAEKGRSIGKLIGLWAVAMLRRPSRCDVRLFSLVDAFGFMPSAAAARTTPIIDPVIARHVPSRASARMRLGIDDGSTVVGLLGAVDSRKNPGIVADGCAIAFANLKGRLLVIGDIRSDALSAICSSTLTPDQLILLDRYVSEDELAAAARACDALALLYDNHGSSSGLLALAAQAGTGVIVPTGSRLDAIAEAGGFGVGATVTPGGFAQAVETVSRVHDALGVAASAAATRLGVGDFAAKLLARES